MMLRCHVHSKRNKKEKKRDKQKHEWNRRKRLVEKGEITFNYEEKKPRIKKADDLEEFNFGSKANPLAEKKVYKTKAGFKAKTYGKNEGFAETRTPAYKRAKFTGKIS